MTTTAQVAASAALHLTLVLLVVWLVGHALPPRPRALGPRASAPPIALPRLVFVAHDSPGGGGGGGGNRQPGPVRRAEAPGRDRATLRVTQRKPAPVTPAAVATTATLPAAVLDARPLASGQVGQFGLPSGGVPFGTSLGPGAGGGVGDGVGTGIGSGQGPGIGPGSGGGTGGGVYRPGGGVSSPQLLVQVRPTYTNDALLRKVQGTVVLELVVTSAGLPAGVRVVRTLDPDLDTQAVNAVSQWRFAPGRLAGKAVDVLVTAYLDFTIR